MTTENTIAPPIPNAPITQADLEDLPTPIPEYYHRLFTTIQIPIGIDPYGTVIWGIRHDD